MLWDTGTDRWTDERTDILTEKGAQASTLLSFEHGPAQPQLVLIYVLEGYQHFKYKMIFLNETSLPNLKLRGGLEILVLLDRGTWNNKE